MVGISTSYFSARGYLIYNSVKRAYEMGFRLIELGANHDYEENIWLTLQKIKQDFPKAVFLQHCYFPPVFKTPVMTNLSEGLTQNNQHIFHDMFKAADILKTKIISFHPGFNCRFAIDGQFQVFKGFKKFKAQDKILPEKARSNLYNCLKFLLIQAKAMSLSIAIENVFSPTGNEPTLKTMNDFKNLFNQYPDLNFLYDYGHSYQADHGQPDQFMSFRGKIIEMHLHDVDKNNVDHRLLGTGKINLDRLFSRLKRLKIKPMIVLEHSAEPTEAEIYQEKKLIENYLS